MMSGRVFTRSVRDPAAALRQTWLPIRRRFIPDHSRRDQVYRWLRLQLLHSQTLYRRLARNREHQRFQLEYQRFQKMFEPSLSDLAQQRVNARQWKQPPVFSIATAVFLPPVRVFSQTVESIRQQTYPHWRWHVVDASPTDRVWQYLERLAASDPRIEPIRVRENQGIAANINHALRACTGDFVVMLDHDDTLAPFSLYALAGAIRSEPNVDVLYSDCDKLDRKGRRCEPFFKPDWSPELLLCANYLEHVTVFRRSLLDRVGWLDSTCDGAADWDFYLRIAEHTQAFAHVAQVLYHWRKSPTSTAQDIQNKPGIHADQQKAVLGHLRRRGLLEPGVEFDRGHPIHSHYPSVRWKLPVEPPLSVVIPTLDHADLLAVCLEGIFHRTAYTNLEVVLVDTGSIEPATHDLYRSLAGRPDVRIVEYREPFNFSKACNVGVDHAGGELVLLLNNDIEILHSDWLLRMVQWFGVPGVGIVGPKMFYPNGRIHHGGVVVGMGGLASILFMDGAEHVDSIFGPEGWYRNLSAVSGACLLTTRKLYDELGGLDERFLLNYSDVDFCVRATERGHRVVFTPDARLVHHESATHGRRIPRTDFLHATAAFQRLLRHGDPFFNPNLSCHNCHPSLRRDRRDNPWDANHDLLARLPRAEIIRLPDDLEEPAR